MISPGNLAPGAVFARDYTIVRPLSEGGMGSIYVVQQISTGMQRALKLMHPDLVREPKLRQRFEQEARIGARIESEHVVQVLGAGVDEATGMPWLVMELLNGQDLRDLLADRGPLPVAEVRDIFAQFTHAVAAAHRVGIVHRDLKPENIFVARARREGVTHFVKVLDFGIAKVVAEAKTRATQALGTPIWMAPEQTETGRSIAPAADVWSLGLIAFRMFTGKHFWISANSEEATSHMVLREAVFDPIKSASARAEEYGVAHLLPPGFDGWFSRCVVRELDARFENAGLARDGFVEMLGGTLSGPSAPRTTPGAPAGVSSPGLPPTGPTPSSPTPAGAPFGAGPVGTSTPSSPVVAAQTQAVVPHVAPLPAAPARQARSGGSRAGLWGALALVAVVAGGFGVRAHLRAEKVKTCESGKGDDLLAACKAACSVDPKKFCVVHGDLARTALDTPSLEAASQSYEKACKAEDWLGCRKLGSLQEVEKNEAAALENYKKSCDGKSASGCAWLGRRMERGRGVPRDAAKAVAFYEAACAGDDPASCALLGWSGESRPIPRPDAAELEAHYKKAVPALRKECASGGLLECVALGTLLQNGKGPDLAATGTFFNKACQGGVQEGCNNAAVLELLDAAKGGSKALDVLRNACAAGTQASCNNLAVLQAGVPFTLRQEQGVSLFKVTCSDAVTLGCTQNGTVVQPPAGIPKDLAGAVAALDKACTEGLGMACANLGAFHESGLGVPKDATKALPYYEKACAAGAGEGCASMRESPFRAGDVWVGNYVCGQGVTDLTIRILEPSADQRVHAIFDFDYGHGKAVGRFLLSGAYDAAKGFISFSPGIWLEQPHNYMTVGLSGHVSLQKTLFTGKIDAASCGAFRVVRMVSDMVAPQCEAGSRFVEGHGCVPIPHAGPTAIGTWNGKGVETGGSSWNMTGTFKNLESGRCGQVTYSTLSCTGDWYCVKSSDGKKIRAREIITSGQNRCDSTGFIDVTVSDDGQTADWRWSSPVRPGGSTAHLTRAAAP